jgi:hypothetical protein
MSGAARLGRLDPEGAKTMSEFVLLFRSTGAEHEQAMGTPERAHRSMQAWLTWLRDLELKGHLKDPGQPLAPSGKVVRGEKRIVSDGPFAESKDLVLGFIIVEARDLDHVVELVRGNPLVEGGGSVEIRPVMEGMV